MTSPTPGSRIDALRRPTGERMIAGVASGIGRALNIDPVIVRIAFVVLTFIGFAGPLLYLACWLLVPAEGSRLSSLGEALGLESDSQLRSIGLIVAGVIAVAAVLGDSAWGVGGWFWGPLWVLAWIAIPIGALYWLIVVRPRQNAPAPFAPPPPYDPDAGVSGTSPLDTSVTDTSVTDTSASDPGASAMSSPVDTSERTAVLGDPGSPAVPPPGAPPTSVLPPRPPRQKWSPALLLVTLSAIVAAMGALGLWSVTQEPLDVAVYPAVALAIVVLGLLVGTKVGHPGALVVVGLLLMPVLAVASIAPNLTAGNIERQPMTAASIAEPIEQGFGRVYVDLSTIEDPEALTGRTLEIENGMGETTVIVPDGLDVDVAAELSAGGRIEVFGKTDDGPNPTVDWRSDAPGAYRIVINGTAGEIEVIRR